MRVALEFFVELGKIGRRLVGRIGAPPTSPEYGSLQLSIIPAFWQRPLDEGGQLYHIEQLRGARNLSTEVLLRNLCGNAETVTLPDFV